MLAMTDTLYAPIISKTVCFFPLKQKIVDIWNMFSPTLVFFLKKARIIAILT